MWAGVVGVHLRRGIRDVRQGAGPEGARVSLHSSLSIPEK